MKGSDLEEVEPILPSFKQFLANVKEINKNFICRNVIIASTLRNIGNVALITYLPVFYQQVFPKHLAEYSLLNAIQQMLAFSSIICGAILSHKFEKKTFMVQPLLCMLGAWLAIPLTVASCICFNNFYLSMALSSLSIFISGSFFGPAITMMQNSVSQENYGNVVSLYTFITNFIRSPIPALVTILAHKFGAIANPKIYGYLLAGFTTFGFGLSGIFYWRAGRAYAQMMRASGGAGAAGSVGG